jgi:hypothetical protein
VQQPVLDQADRPVQILGQVVIEHDVHTGGHRRGVHGWAVHRRAHRRRAHRWRVHRCPAWNSSGSRAKRAGPPITFPAVAAGVGSCSRACSSIRAIKVTSTTSSYSARAQAASVAAGP